MAKKDNTTMYLLLAGGLGVAALLFFRSKKASGSALVVKGAAPATSRDLSNPLQRYQWQRASMLEGGNKQCYDHKLGRTVPTDICDTYMPETSSVLQHDPSMLEGWR